jgi:uroporphyrin-3 C-methyltransferase
MVTDKKTTPPAADDKQPSAKVATKATTDKPSPADSAATKKTATQKPPRNKPVAETKKGFPWIKTLLVLILIGALAAGGWLGWTEWQNQINSRAGQSDSLQNDMAVLERKLEQQQQLNRQTVQQQSQLIGQLEDQLYSVKLRLNSQAERILQLGTASRGDWILSEAAYLIRLANQRLQVERSIENPLAILENVDNIFVQLNDPELIPVRRALAKDIAALRMTGKIDREGIFLELEAISAAIKDLSIIEPANQTDTAKPVVDESDQAPSLLDSFERFSQKLGQLIVVQKRQQPIEPLLTSNEQSIIQNNLYLLLEQAQSALLKEEQIIYSTSLEKTAALLARYFQLNSQSQALIERLTILAERSVIQGLPDISGSVVAVQTMLTLRQSRISEGEQEQ